SDVPFFLYGKTALVTGKGENVSPILSLPKTWFILVKPKISISTKWAYENFDLKPKHSESPDTNEMVELMQKGSKEKFFKLLYNDFERIVYKNYPSLKAIKDLLLDLGADNSLLSGSGSVIFGISSTYEKAQEIYNKIIPYNLGKVYICNSI
ncbi:hypothetical protein HZA55_00070, partial [Candidatus Poribacteria bacterium]|nr:hypothetical protein [Candidatus Poribacteria bacterium]